MRDRDEFELDALFLSQSEDVACRIDRGKQHIDLAVDQPLVRGVALAVRHRICRVAIAVGEQCTVDRLCDRQGGGRPVNDGHFLFQPRLACGCCRINRQPPDAGINEFSRLQPRR